MVGVNLIVSPLCTRCTLESTRRVMFRRPVPRGELVEEAAASEEEEVDSWSTSDEEEQEDSRDYCKGQGPESS